MGLPERIEPPRAATAWPTRVATGERAVRVCVPITAFPVAGGMRGVVTGIAAAMHDVWRVEYLTRAVGPDAERYPITRFGAWWMYPSEFPHVLAYTVAGARALGRLLRQAPGYDLILAQDGVFTGAFAVFAGRRAGVPVFCMDHGNVTLMDSPAFRAERMAAVRQARAPLRWVKRAQLACYLLTLRLLARYVARGADGLLPAGDDVADAWRDRFGVAPEHLARFPFMIDSARFAPVTDGYRATLRHALALPTDALVISMVNRLAPEKGLATAIAGLADALDALPAEVRARVRVLIAGDGPLRAAVARDVAQRGLAAVVRPLGEQSPDAVARVLAASDIFLYTGTRAINSLGVLEAMAAGCAVVASTEPRLIARYLADGRGLAIPAGNPEAVRDALVALAPDAARRAAMGQRARAYVVEHFSAAALRRALLVATATALATRATAAPVSAGEGTATT